MKNEGSRARDKIGTTCSQPEMKAQINIVAYGGVAASVSTTKPVSPTSEIRPSAESQQDFLRFYVYIVYVK